MKKKIRKDFYGGKILGNQTTFNPREKNQNLYEIDTMIKISETINYMPITSKSAFISKNHK